MCASPGRVKALGGEAGRLAQPCVKEAGVPGGFWVAVVLGKTGEAL